MKRQEMIYIGILFCIALGFAAFFVNGYFECNEIGGTYVRTMMGMECLK